MTDLLTLGQVPILGTSRDPNTARLKVSINEEVFDGNKAITTQSFSELNSKLGTQWQVGYYLPSLANGASTDILIEVGNSDPVLIKGLISQFKGDAIQTALYRDPVFTGPGTVIPKYNMKDYDPATSDVVFRTGVTVTDLGTQVSPTITSLGQGTGNPSPGLAAPGTFGDTERVLEPGVTYLYRLTNIGGSATPITGLATFYQGPLSTDTPLTL